MVPSSCVRPSFGLAYWPLKRANRKVIRISFFLLGQVLSFQVVYPVCCHGNCNADSIDRLNSPAYTPRGGGASSALYDERQKKANAAAGLWLKLIESLPGSAPTWSIRSDDEQIFIIIFQRREPGRSSTQNKSCRVKKMKKKRGVCVCPSAVVCS
jgi:hypothetical protein